jgi:D-alanyl-D-alanine carboxypeptidase (penicillin-binding protein 5/6)
LSVLRETGLSRQAGRFGAWAPATIAGCSALLLLCALVLLGPRPASAQLFQSAAPQAILVDVETGSVLYEQNADDLVPPASLAKLMTLEVLFNAVHEGRLTLDSEISISEHAWRKGGAPSRSSTMFAALGSRIKISDIIAGIAVLSGNDACIAVAEAMAGDEVTFGRMMTERARKIGLEKSVFVNPTGLPAPDQKVTMREIARLSEHLIRTYPEFYAYFGMKDFTWSKIRQTNRNPLLGMDIGADGLKTGETDESGFALAGSAVQDGRRLIVAVSGLKTARDRASEARKLLEWGFRSFESRTLFEANTPIGEVKVFGGASFSVPVVSAKPVRALVPRGSAETISARIVYRGPLTAPVKAGTVVGTLLVSRGKMHAVSVPVQTMEDVPVGPLHDRALQAIWEWAGDYIRSKLPKSFS